MAFTHIRRAGRFALCLVAGGLAAAVLAAPAGAARIVQYEGEVLNGEGTEFGLGVLFRGGAPVALRSFKSDKLTVPCETGTQMRRTALNLPPFVPGTLRPKDGYFQWTTHFILVPDGVEYRRDRVRGFVEKEVASGFLRIDLFDEPGQGECDTGRLDWTAERSSSSTIPTRSKGRIEDWAVGALGEGSIHTKQRR